MTGRLQNLETQRAHSDQLSPFEPIRANSELRIGGPYATTNPLSEHCCAFGVIKMPVCQHDRDELTGTGRKNGFQVSLDGRTGVDHQGTIVLIGDHPGVRSVQSHRPGIGRPNQPHIWHSGRVRGCHVEVSGRVCG